VDSQTRQLWADVMFNTHVAAVCARESAMLDMCHYVYLNMKFCRELDKYYRPQIVLNIQDIKHKLKFMIRDNI
jgi:phosphatidylserine decarboxylase